MLNLASIVAEYAIQDAGYAIGRVRRKAVLYTLAAALAFAAFLAGLTGLGFYLSPIFGPAAAAFLIALGVLALSISVVAVGLVWNRIDRQRRDRSGNLAVTAAISLLPHLLRSNTTLALAAAGGVGFLAAQAVGGTAKKN